MDAPTCRLCGKQHWLRGLCRLAEPTVETSCLECARLRNHVTILEAEIVALRNQIVTIQQPITASATAPVTIDVVTPKRNRAAYMREYRASARRAV